MDRRFGRRGKWFALGLLALVFLCIVACIGTAAMLALRPAGIWMQPPAGEGGVVPRAVYHPAHGIWAFLRFGAGLLFLGLFVLLILKLVRRLFWGSWHAVSPYGYGPWWGAPQGAPEGEAGGSETGAGWRPPAWKRRAWRHHHHAHPWGPPPWWGPRPPTGSEAEASAGSLAEAGEDQPDGPANEYTGPME